MSETWLQHKELVEEEMRDLSSYLAGIPPSLRSSGAFAAYEGRLELLQQQLSHLQVTRQARRDMGGQQPQIFLNYASEDRSLVSTLYQQLLAVGFKPWMDNRDIVGGKRWRANIDRTLRNAHFFLACLSTNSIEKRGVIEKEREVALEIQEIFPPDVPYFIPVRLEMCDVPQKLSIFQWIDLFEEDGFDRLCKAIETGMQQRFPPGRGAIRVQSADGQSIVIQGTLVLPIYPTMGVSGAVRLYAGNFETLVHPRKLEEFEEMWRMKLPVNGRITPSSERKRHQMYDLGFMFPGGHLFTSENGFVVPADWPFEEEDIRLGSDITEQFSLTFRPDGALIVRRRRR